MLKTTCIGFSSKKTGTQCIASNKVIHVWVGDSSFFKSEFKQTSIQWKAAFHPLHTYGGGYVYSPAPDHVLT